MAKKRKANWKVEPTLTGYELSTVAAILQVMADRGTAAKTQVGSARKILALRDAIPKGLGRGKMESVPREILKEDCRVARLMVKHLTSHHRKFRKKESQVRQIIAAGPAQIQFDTLEMYLPWPCDSIKTSCRFDKPMAPAKRAHFLVSKRYGIPQESVRRAQAKQTRGAKSTHPWWQPCHALLAWILTDLCVLDNPSSGVIKRRDRIFNTLMTTGYEPFVLYYRLLLAQSTGKVRAHRPSETVTLADIDRLLALVQRR